MIWFAVMINTFVFVSNLLMIYNKIRMNEHYEFELLLVWISFTALIMLTIQ
jgi:hypothetical protein